jgi:hypothetical protein
MEVKEYLQALKTENAKCDVEEMVGKKLDLIR